MTRTVKTVNIAQSNKTQKRLDRAAMWSTIIGIALSPLTMGASATIGLNVAAALGVAANAKKINEVNYEYHQGMISQKSRRLQLGFAITGTVLSALGSEETVQSSLVGLKDAAEDFKFGGSILKNGAKLVEDTGSSPYRAMVDDVERYTPPPMPEYLRSPAMQDLQEGSTEARNSLRISRNMRTSGGAMRESLVGNPTMLDRADNFLQNMQFQVEDMGERLHLQDIGNLRGIDRRFLEKGAQVGISINNIMSSDYNQDGGQISQNFQGKNIFGKIKGAWDTTVSELTKGGVGFSAGTIGVVSLFHYFE